MSYEFTALPVNAGDAFLLKVPDGHFLVDGGEETGNINIINLLMKENINHLKAAILTHSHTDHLNGIMDLMQKSFSVDEYWLPSGWLDLSSVLNAFDGNWEEVIDELKKIRTDGQLSILTKGDEVDLDSDYIQENPNDFAFYKKIHKHVIHGHQEHRKQFNFKNTSECLAEIARCCDLRKQNVLKEELTLLSRSFLLANTLNLRFFEFKGKVVNYPANSTFKCVNGKEIFRSVIRPSTQISALTCALFLQKLNKESLVYHYATTNVEIVFCADSDWGFLNNSPSFSGNFLLTKPAIVTAPHHGADANKNVYNKISSSSQKPVKWVRSDALDGRSSTRPCNKFKNLKDKYCTACNKRKQEVKLDFISGQWLAQGNPYTCIPGQAIC